MADHWRATKSDTSPPLEPWLHRLASHKFTYMRARRVSCRVVALASDEARAARPGTTAAERLEMLAEPSRLVKFLARLARVPTAVCRDQPVRVRDLQI